MSEPQIARVALLLKMTWLHYFIAIILLHLHRLPYCSKICCSVKANALPRLVPFGMMNSSVWFPLKLPIRPVV